MKLTNKSEIKKIIGEHGFYNLKSLGQNFIVNPRICPKIARSKPKGGFVLEIGPGIGTLTKELAISSDKVVAIEKDERLLQILTKTLDGYENIEVILGDILKMDLSEIFEKKNAGQKGYVCANLPYYITTPIIMKLLEEYLPVDEIIVMVQKEAAIRLAAKLGTKDAGSISFAINYYAKIEILFFVMKGSFYPMPKVDSAVIKLTKRKEPAVRVDDGDKFLNFIKRTFSKRRKNIVNAVSSSLDTDKNSVEKALIKLNIPFSSRPQELTLEEFANIYNAL